MDRAESAELAELIRAQHDVDGMKFYTRSAFSPSRVFELRFNVDGTLDEVCAKGVMIHLEQMDTGAWWLGIDAPNGDHLRLWLSTAKPDRTKVTVRAGWEPK